MNQIQIQNKLVTVGDIFVDEWGYDQTNVDFYKVVGITPSGKRVKIVAIGQTIHDDTGDMTELVIPNPNEVTGKVLTKRIDVWSGHITAGKAWDWDGKPVRQSHYA